ncbi:oxygenase MpaB family protein [Candidatus Frankia nodulisporulans]|uniref:oxygenase MpaB family protein n=1 Tax=Candidatus Frankia nodulisporulans TaxID=2060052 RepID=UPI001CDBE009|nr:oxygenase MpaB family protein [Candidatus Frankia nodulisporulans]
MAQLRGWLGGQVFQRVAGPEGAGRRERIFAAPGERWFAEDRPIRLVHADSAMFVGGLRALLLQSLHPLAIAGVTQHSDFRNDPWGRLARTSFFLAATTFGPADEAERAIARVRAVHRRVRGVAADGRPYAAGDPHLMRWVHVAEVDSFLAAYQRYGTHPLDAAQRDGYVADTAVVAERLGIKDPPRTTAELADTLRSYRPELTGTPEARSAARYLLLRAPLPLAARAPYSALAGAAVGLMPVWTRWPLRLPYLPATEATVGRLAGQTIVTTIRWATRAADPAVPHAGLD